MIKSYYVWNKKKVSKQQKAYRDRTDYSKKHYLQNKEKVLKSKKEHYAKNRELILKQQLSYRNKNKDKIAKKNKEYYAQNKDYWKEYYIRRKE